MQCEHWVCSKFGLAVVYNYLCYSLSLLAWIIESSLYVMEKLCQFSTVTETQLKAEKPITNMRRIDESHRVPKISSTCCKIWGSHSGKYKDYCFAGYDMCSLVINVLRKSATFIFCIHILCDTCNKNPNIYSCFHYECLTNNHVTQALMCEGYINAAPYLLITSYIQAASYTAANDTRINTQ